ncbi:MAG: hypothetical protein D6675_14250 [Gemmatimonadetes bacterium]|nr:MAG: hypothetical protein D6675_14250 [Gemmatimonadota bacterium]
MRKFYIVLMWVMLMGMVGIVFAAGGGSGADSTSIAFPPPLDGYHDQELTSAFAIIKQRASEVPFNVVATLIFFLAIIHTFFAGKFMKVAHRWQHEHETRQKNGEASPNSVHLGAEILHFLGEIEVVFGLWTIALGGAILVSYDWDTLVYYVGHHVNYTEPIFVVVIMTLASTRPVLKLSEQIMAQIVKVLGNTLTMWWFIILTVGPLLGSFITEPAAMTICALLLGSKFYQLKPSPKFKYATLGLLFVNISVGGTLTHFAAPPVLMVAAPWGWDMPFMMLHYGWKAALGILISNLLYYFYFKQEMATLEHKHRMNVLERAIQEKFLPDDAFEAQFNAVKAEIDEKLELANQFYRRCDAIRTALWEKTLAQVASENIDPESLESAFEDQFEKLRLREMRKSLPGLLPEADQPPYHDPEWDQRSEEVPLWVMLVHVGFLIWTVVTAHYPALFVGGFLFFLGFAQATAPFQNRINLKPPLLVGFFLAGLVIHGGVQAWWIAPVLGSLTELPLMIGATILTAFNDNAAITYLSTLVPSLTPSLKYAVVAGAVTGGGLTVIANAPNPAGQSILSKYFEDGISPVGLLLGALFPTLVMGFCFMVTFYLLGF